MNEAEYKAAVLAANKAWLDEQVFRGTDFSLTFNFGDIDYSGATFAGQLRLTPDAPGDPVALFSVGTPTFSGGATSITFSLGNSTNYPPAAEPGRTLKIYMDFKITVGSQIERFAAGVLTVIGKVTP